MTDSRKGKFIWSAYQNSVCVTLLQVVMIIMRKLSSEREAVCSWANKTMFFDPVPSLGAILRILRLSHKNYLLTLLSIKCVRFFREEIIRFLSLQLGRQDIDDLYDSSFINTPIKWPSQVRQLHSSEVPDIVMDGLRPSQLQNNICATYNWLISVILDKRGTSQRSVYHWSFTSENLVKLT